MDAKEANVVVARISGVVASDMDEPARLSRFELDHCKYPSAPIQGQCGCGILIASRNGGRGEGKVTNELDKRTAISPLLVHDTMTTFSAAYGFTSTNLVPSTTVYR
jgi:hypothetical protein